MKNVERSDKLKSSKEELQSLNEELATVNIEPLHLNTCRFMRNENHVPLLILAFKEITGSIQHGNNKN